MYYCKALTQDLMLTNSVSGAIVFVEIRKYLVVGLWLGGQSPSETRRDSAGTKYEIKDFLTTWRFKNGKYILKS